MNQLFENSILYKMCADYPKHDNLELIRGKITIIGRVYSATVERQANWNGEYADRIKELAEEIKDSGLDQSLEALKNCNPLLKDKILHSEQLSHSLAVHKKLTDVFHKHTGRHKRSLASKYLHFHLPHSFFIYDKLAKDKITDLVNGEKIADWQMQNIGAVQEMDTEYANFCKKIIAYLNKAKPDWATDPRAVDQHLMGYLLLESWMEKPKL